MCFPIIRCKKQDDFARIYIGKCVSETCYMQLTHQHKYTCYPHYIHSSNITVVFNSVEKIQKGDMFSNLFAPNSSTLTTEYARNVFPTSLPSG